MTFILNLAQFRTISGQVQEEKGLKLLFLFTAVCVIFLIKKGLNLAPQDCTTFLDVSKPAMCYVTCFRIV